MASISITKQWSYNGAHAQIKIVVPYTVTHTATSTQTRTTITIEGGDIQVSYPTSGSGTNLHYAMDARESDLRTGVYCTISCTAPTGTTETQLARFKIPAAGELWVIPTVSSGYWDRTHSAVEKTLRLGLSGTSVTDTSVTKTINVIAKPSYTVTYNANGGAGTVASQTKWHNEALTLRTNAFTRTNYSFKCWNSSTSDPQNSRYAGGASYTGNANITLYAIWNTSVVYNANGGTGAPQSQPKVFNQSLTLQPASANPTRTDFKFLNWNTLASPTTSAPGTTFQPGGTYTGNTYLILYAIWQRIYDSPRLTASAYRSDVNGNPEDEGTYLTVNTNWSIFNTSSEGTTNTATIYATCNNVTATATPSGLSGTTQIVVNANLDSETRYTATVILRDSVGGANRQTPVTLNISTAFYPIDILSGGRGIAFGGAATVQDRFEVFYENAKFNGKVLANEFQTNSQVTYISDCNNATNPLVTYYTDGNTTNRPSVASYNFIRIFGASGNNLLQLAGKMNSQEQTLYARGRNANGEWGSWARINRDLIWKYGSFNQTNLASGGTSVTTTFSFPDLSGYTRFVIGIRSLNTTVICTGWGIDENGYVTLWLWNRTSTAQTATVTFVAAYLSNGSSF